MFILDNIQPFWFLLSLFIGLFLVYIITPTPEIIIKYPTPENANESIFDDDSNNCGSFYFTAGGFDIIITPDTITDIFNHNTRYKPVYPPLELKFIIFLKKLQSILAHH